MQLAKAVEAICLHTSHFQMREPMSHRKNADKAVSFPAFCLISKIAIIL